MTWAYAIGWSSVAIDESNLDSYLPGGFAHERAVNFGIDNWYWVFTHLNRPPRFEPINSLLQPFSQPL